MKCFKKILAAALTGVLALTMLVGCSSGGFNKSEFIKQVGDYEGRTYKDVGESQAAVVETVLNDILKDWNEEEDGPFVPADALRNERKPQEILEKLNVDKDTDDCWYLSIAVLADFTSAHYQKSLEHVLALNVLENQSRLRLVNSPWNRTLSNQGTVSLKTVTLKNGTRCLIGVWKVVA